MKVEAQNLLIQNVLKKGKLIVPDFQREYDWDDVNLNEFFDDINETKNDDNYFIGHMVFEGEFNGSEFIIIDGQQRITTITILLCAIRDRFIELNETDLANAIHESYIFSRDINYQEYPILENRMPYPILQAHIQSKPENRDFSVKPEKEGEIKIISSYTKIAKILSVFDVEKLKILRDKVLNLETIFVAATDLASASTIFMTLNATGKDLSPLDLVKNYLFSLYPRECHIDEPNDTWKEILKNTSGNDKFLNNSFASRYKKIADHKIFKEIIKEVVNDIDAKSFLKDLKLDSVILKKINKPSENDWLRNDHDIFESINAISKIFKVEVANSFLISLIREYEDKKISKIVLMKILNVMEKFHFIHTAICSNRSSGYDKLYARNAKLLYEAADKEKKHNIILNFKSELELKIPDEEQYKANFDKKLYYTSKETKQKPLVQYVLNKLERQKNPNAILINTSIEHIYPEKHDLWEDLGNSSLIKNIGNLVLLDSGLNSEIGNKVFSKKKVIIENRSQLITTKEVFEKHKQWSDDEILNRNLLLHKYLYSEIWL
ncbi:MAG: DUF262 domain-containing protein [Bacteroidia bacterium]|nr:DUF262 domain-containing HNH endonuclease family protein [Bacteroidales bacterium]NCC19059.1 DUF262 domain-containing protein [Bacteroidia bacterium]